MPAGVIGNDTTVTLTTSAVTMEIIDGDLSMSRASVDVSNNSNTLGATSVITRQFAAGSIDFGTSNFTVSFNSDELHDVDGAGVLTPYLFGDVAENITITWPLPAGSANTTEGTFVCSGFFQDFNIAGIGLDSHLTASVTVKWAGTPAWTASS